MGFGVNDNTETNALIDRLYSDFGKDAGGRTRVSQITTLLAGKILGADDTTLFENVGTGTATYGNNKLKLILTFHLMELRIQNCKLMELMQLTIMIYLISL